jgi:HlyD family secretion protein
MGSRRLVRRSTVLPAVLVVLTTGAGLAWATAGSAAPGYRTAVVSTGDVAQLLTVTGTVQNVDQTKVSFPVTGTVATVAAQVGATVSKGQLLATLDAGPLNNTVVAATAALAKAEAALETDSTSTTTSTTTVSPARTAAPASASASTAARAPTGGAGTAASAGTATVLAESAALLALAQKALAVAATACAPASTTAPETGSPTPSLTAAPSGDAATPSTSPSPISGTATAAAPTDCAVALTAALDAQQKVTRSQVEADRTLRSATGGGTAGAGGAAASPSASPAAQTGAAGTASGSTASPGVQGQAAGQSQAARITTDQAAVAAARVALDVANKNLAGATLTSPIDGKIASQPFEVGASSGTASIVVVAPGAVQITVNVPGSALSTLKVGQPAAVTPDGAGTAISGTVAAIGLLPTSSTSGSTTTYPVRVLVPKPGTALVEGAAASVAITVRTAHGVLTVPNSALSDGAVTVLTQGKPVPTRVQTGTVGPLTTEVTSGLQAGQQVVLADLSAPLPANSTTTRGFGGTGGPPGGFTGAPPGGGQGVRPGG